MQTPISESYWVLPDQFLAGEYPGNYDQKNAQWRIESFLKAGINTFLDLTHPHELVPYEPILEEQARLYGLDLSYTRISIQDRSVPSFQTMKNILDVLDNAINAGRKVYVHCWGGIGRTGTTVGCYLIRHGMSGEQALAQIAEWWKFMPKRIYFPRAPETDMQVEFIRNWREIPDDGHQSQQNFCEG